MEELELYEVAVVVKLQRLGHSNPPMALLDTVKDTVDEVRGLLEPAGGIISVSYENIKKCK